MGSCLSKKSVSASAVGSAHSPVSLPENPKSEPPKESEEETHDAKTELERRHCPSGEEKSEPEEGKNAVTSNGGAVRTSSCTKEELDAILIQCGRLSRSSSGNPARKYSGSKRSYDFDGENGSGAVDGDEGDAAARERETRRRSQGRRRTPSREREQRSGSRERCGRRVSKSPGRRSESPITTNSNPSANPKPGKMISVPATVPSAGGDANNDEPMKRIHAKKKVGGSPRTRSPARIQNPNSQPTSLSSRKAEHSPYRRNPLAEIDTNVISQKPNETTKPSAYTALLLEDIQNFHHKKTTSTSFHKYVTVKRGSGEDDDVEDLESSGSNKLTNSVEWNDKRTSSSRPVASGKKVSSEKNKVADNRRSSNAIACSAGGST